MSGGQHDEDQHNGASSALYESVPDFRAVGVHEGLFKEVSLSDYHGRYLLLVFYPLDFNTLGPSAIKPLPVPAAEFGRRIKEFERLDCAVVGVSTDSHYVHLAYAETSESKGGLGNKQICLLSDVTMELSRKLGFLKEDEHLAFNGVALLGKQGELLFRAIADLPFSIDPDEVQRVLKAVRGEVIHDDGDDQQGGDESQTDETH